MFVMLHFEKSSKMAKIWQKNEEKPYSTCVQPISCIDFWSQKPNFQRHGPSLILTSKNIIYMRCTTQKAQSARKEHQVCSILDIYPPHFVLLRTKKTLYNYWHFKTLSIWLEKWGQNWRNRTTVKADGDRKTQ